MTLKTCNATLAARFLIGIAAIIVPASGLAQDYSLVLGGQHFDPVSGPQPQAAWFDDLSSGPDLRLVQLRGVPRDQALAQLHGSGVQVIQYIHPFTYVVWGDHSQLQQAQSLGEVRWTGDLSLGFRVQPRYRSLASSVIDVRVLRFRGAPIAAFNQHVASLGANLGQRRNLDHRFEHVGLRVRGDRLQNLAAAPGVYAIHLVPQDGGNRAEMSNQLNVGNYDMTNLAFPGYQAWLTTVGLSGAGVVMANVDSGVDETHPDLVNRFIACTGVTCGTDSSGHGTHTAGIMAGDAASGTTLTTAGGTFLRGLGMAPGATMVEQDYSGHFSQPGGMLLLMTDSAANGALLSGNSWGPAGSPQGYDDDTLQVDIGVRDADSVAPGNQEFSYVLSFMNGFGGTNTQGSPDEAKNIFTIGSTKAQQGGGEQDLAINDLSANSAHGPALDGRTIPHMVAPGCRVDSSDWDGGPGFDYSLRCGTSMASPHVSGAVALFLEYYQNLTAAIPSPALIKAAFISQAMSLAGHDDADGGTLGHPFDSKQGWGRMDVMSVVDPQLSIFYFDQEHRFDQSTEEWSEVLRVDDAGQPVRIMLVWTDAPGHGMGGATPAWNNDLDLQVTVEGETYLGNVFGGDGFSVTGGSADGMNNTEGVFLDAGEVSAAFTVRVLASNINSDGVPNLGDATDQDFALVCVNCKVPDVIYADGLESVP